MARLRRRRRTSHVGPFERPSRVWAALGSVDPFDNVTGLRPDTVADRVRVIVSGSALTPDELAALERAADGSRPLDGLPADRAAAALARWRGPISGLRLLPLAHHLDERNER